MNLIPARRRRPARALRTAYFAAEENPRAETSRTTLHHTTNPAQRYTALAFLADRETHLHRLHDDALGHDPWPNDTAGDAATGLAHGAMILRLLAAAEKTRAARRLWDLPDPSWNAHWQPTAWGRADLTATDQALADACGPLLDRLAAEDDLTETAALYTRLWITAYPVVGGQAAEWIAVLGQDFMCLAAGVQDGPDTVLALPDAGSCGVHLIPATT